jgi:two-component system, OmpR family, phosphate regulon sensor histidine kinase PhoR
MPSAKEDLRIALSGQVLSAALVLDWMAGNWLPMIPWGLRAGLLMLAAVLGFYTLYRCWGRNQRSHLTALDYLEQLVRTDVNQWATALPASPFTERRREGWSNLCERLGTTLAAAGRRIQELEQARAAQETCDRRSEADYDRIEEAILAGLPDPVIAVDNAGALVLANPSAEKLFEIPNQTNEQRALSQLLRCEKLVQLLTETRQGQPHAPGNVEVEIADQDGQSHWFNVTAHALPHAESEAGRQLEHRAAVAVLRDISTQKSLQKRNAEFVSAVSHEMKTPLSGIKAYVELLADGDAEDLQTQEEFLSVINSQANRLERLVDNLLNLARIEAGVVSARKQSWSLNDLLLGALEIVRPAGERKQLTLTAELSPFHLGVLVDRDMLLDAVINLLSNAINYTQPGGKIVLRSRRVDNAVRFEVEDTGVGLSPNDSRKVFEKFYRVQKDKDMATGTGLGLPLVRHIVEDVHGGRISVESVPDQGSVFSVMLPLVESTQTVTPALKA